ncbi:hypothetical protein QJQ45_019972, partial [Haematococcus lacustris]
QSAQPQGDERSGQLIADQLDRWKLTKGQGKHDSCLNNARCDTERWLAPIKPHLQHLAAANSAGTSLVANLKHITVTLATWDAVWEVYLDPKWARQRLRLYGAQDRALEQLIKKVKLEEDMAEVSMERHGRAKQLVVFFGAASIGTGGGWGADAVLRACCKVVCRPRGAGQRRGRVVLVDEHRTTRVSSAVNGQQPCEEQLNQELPTRPADWKPSSGQVDLRLLRPAWSQRRDQPVRGMMWCPVVAPRKPPQPPRSSQVATQPAASEPGPSTPPPAKRSKHTEAEQAVEPSQPTKGKGKTKGKAAKAKPAPQPGRWLDRDCNAALIMQRFGESRWCPLELRWCPLELCYCTMYRRSARKVLAGTHNPTALQYSFNILTLSFLPKVHSCITLSGANEHRRPLAHGMHSCSSLSASSVGQRNLSRLHVAAGPDDFRHHGCDLANGCVIASGSLTTPRSCAHGYTGSDATARERATGCLSQVIGRIGCRVDMVPEQPGSTMQLTVNDKKLHAPLSQARRSRTCRPAVKRAGTDTTTIPGKKCKLYTVMTGVSAAGLEAGAVMASEVVEARLVTQLEAWVKACSMRALLANLLLGLIVRGRFTRVAVLPDGQEHSKTSLLSGYKRLRDKPPKAQQQQQPAVAQ